MTFGPLCRTATFGPSSPGSPTSMPRVWTVSRASAGQLASQARSSSGRTFTPTQAAQSVVAAVSAAAFRAWRRAFFTPDGWEGGSDTVVPFIGPQVADTRGVAQATTAGGGGRDGGQYRPPTIPTQ